MSSTIEKSKRLLIVDDSEAIRRFLADMFVDRGFSVKTASDGIEAQRILDKKSYDVVLIDLNMPVVSGIELYQRIEKRNPHIASKIIFMSVDVPDSRIQSFFTKINRPFLLKPFTMDEFLSAVSN